MNTTRRPMRVVASLAALLALAGCTSIAGVPSAGGYAPYAPPVEGESVTLRDSFDSSVQDTHDYWSNPDMFTDADGIDYTDPNDGTSTGGDPATGTYFPPTVASPAAESPNGYGVVPTGTPFDRNGLGASTFGRLYIQLEGENYVCSATVVNSTSGDIVATAAHCLAKLDGSKAVAESVMFIPGDSNDGADQPYGRWAARDYSLSQTFLDNALADEQGRVSGSGWSHDFAFLTMEEQNGQSIQDVTGGQGIAFGVPVQAITQIGYPTAPPYDGTNEYFCASTSWTQSSAGGYSHACDMTQGSSGGAWNAYYDSVLGAGYVIAVNSTGSQTTSNGAALGKDALRLYEEADA